ncbi:acyl-CoA carboxylase subunit beta [Mesorhizobium microcysteis]|uniref:Acyl-CoA carboxylase subunit beta n=1 Tax=Neoaquamicrobium microcysteis TaxID=2682781 RepID=A0A5D4GQ20_9HYPH|nr:carboxyl transferase domain-containing protein [Mesorhizobium microcysteis]TYR30152.1 acyl-CoA carboxylase subunit beta [Mesorhizobium microcysteis]
MPVLSSSLDTHAPAFRENVEAMDARLAEVRRMERAVRDNSASKKARFEERGQLLPRERVERLLDRGRPFLELSTLAGYRMHDDDGDKNIMGGGTIAGIGVVAGRRCIVSASDSGIKGGTIPPIGLKKALRLHEIAFENRLPLIYLVESGGANLLHQAEMFVEGGRSFANQARLSAAGIPQIAIVHGSSTAGGAYLPGLSDYVVLVRGRSKIFLAGPPLVKAAIGEDADDEMLGGADLHGSVTGLGEYVAEDDAQALALGRAIMENLSWDAASERSPSREPKYAVDELPGIVPADERAPFDMKEVVARIADGSDFLEFKAAYSPDTICGHAAIEGYRIGIIGNNGPIMPTGSLKAAQFIQLCDQTGTPLVFLQNTTGYMVGSAAEREGAIKHGSKMIQAVANARVPKFTIVIGGSYGAGNYGMCGRGFSPRFIFSWPSARTAVMGGEQAARVMEIVARGKAEREGRQADEDALAKQGAMIRAGVEAQSTALFATARLWDDGIIDPRDTRRILGLCLSIAAEGDARVLRPNAFGVARG